MEKTISEIGYLLLAMGAIASVLWWVVRHWISDIERKIEAIKEEARSCQLSLGDRYLKRAEWDTFQKRYNNQSERFSDKLEKILVQVLAQEKISNERYATFWDKANRLRDLIIGLVQELVLRPKPIDEAKDYATRINSQLVTLFKNGSQK
jgi:hypothetical protein